MMCSTFDIRFNQSPGAVLALTNGRRMGITYSYRNKRHYMSGGAFMDNEVNNLKKDVTWICFGWQGSISSGFR